MFGERFAIRILLESGTPFNSADLGPPRTYWLLALVEAASTKTHVANKVVIKSKKASLFTEPQQHARQVYCATGGWRLAGLYGVLKR